MGFSFNFFGESYHRDFNYKPRYYDPKEEERKRIFGDDKPESGTPAGESSKDYVPGQYIRGSFTDGNYRKLKLSSANRAQKIIGMLGLILFFCVLYFIARFYGLITG